MDVNTMAREEHRLQGTFQLPHSQEAFGELLLKEDKSLLRLTSHSHLPPLQEFSALLGTTLDRQQVTCIDCVLHSQGSAWRENTATHHYAEIFPHFVTIGDEHIDPNLSMVRSIHFAVDDLSFLFYDFDAFGSIHAEKPLIESVIAKRGHMRPVETGEWSHIAYFTGKFTVVEVETEIGKVAVNHSPSFSMGGPDGVFIKNQMVVSVEPSSPVAFDEAVDRMMTIVRFLSVMAGRWQGVHGINLRTTTSDKPPLSVYWSYAPRSNGATSSYLKPHPGDVPLDPVRRTEEFSNILRNWIGRDSGWRVPRIRYLSGLSKGNSYDVDRLVAAANLFDILPVEAIPSTSTLPDDLAKSQAECLTILKRHSPSQDRDSAISAIKRMGRPSLPKKVLHRTSLVEMHFGSSLSELSSVVKIAVQCRNYFVHGGSLDFNFVDVEPFTSFLTDALEFVFAASDLIEAGWDAAQWKREPHGTGHNFARFLAEYNPTLSKLKLVQASPN